MSYMQSAFEQVCKDAKPAEGFYVTLMCESQRYGGPEEGGWPIVNTHVVAYQHFSTEEAANAAKTAVEKLARELQEQAQKAHGDYCLQSMEWLDERGLDADFLPEPDGPDTFFVVMSEGIPEEYRGPTHYE